MACHAHRPYDQGEVQRADRGQINPKYKPDATATLDPSGFPESVRDYAKADFGPNLSNIAAKFQSHDQGYKWLANWIKAPEAYHPKSLMPNLQLSWQDSADIASWILSVPGEWPVAGRRPGRRLRRGQGRARRAGPALRHQGGVSSGTASRSRSRSARSTTSSRRSSRRTRS